MKRLSDFLQAVREARQVLREAVKEESTERECRNAEAALDAILRMA